MKRMPRRKGKSLSKSKNNILLVDGNALFKTGYHGAKHEYNSAGNHIGGIYQFLTMLRKMLNEDLYHKAYVFWDGELSGKLRYDIYADYKSNRNKDYVNGTKPEDDEEQIIERLIVQQYLGELNIRQLEDKVVESDDFIAYYCNKFKDEENITIVTNDRDLCQLISQNVKIYLIDKKDYVTLDNYNQFFKHYHKNSVLIKVISGDSSDSINGVKGVKETTLLKHFPMIKDREVDLKEVISESIKLQSDRVENKKKPLKSIDNLINGKTIGLQGDKLYEINQKLIDLTEPLVTPEAENDLNILINKKFSKNKDAIKNVLNYMKRDGIDFLVKNYADDYLMPFKKLMIREEK